MNAGSCPLPDPRQNQLLAALGESQFQRWLPHLEHVEMPLGRVLSVSGHDHEYAYFPTTAIVSLMYVTSAGSSTETTVVGNEGVVGISLFLGGHATLGQAVVQTAACNRYHSIDQLFCRRLVMSLERLPSDSMAMTQELAAGLLGVRREGVTAAAHKLQRDGVIDYRRGHVAVLDRPRLEARTCDVVGYEGMR